MNLELSELKQLVVDTLNEKFNDDIIEVYQSTGDVYILVKPSSIIPVTTLLRDELSYTYLSDLFGIDRYTSEERFEVVYNLVSLKNGDRLFLKVRCEEENPQVESLSGVFKAANWFEREVYDMFGIRFSNHPDLRRMFMPEDFQYFPLRKEFPLLGIPGSIELPSTTPDSE